MAVRKIEEKKYRTELYFVTWHAASESVWRGKERIYYSDMDGDHCYFYRLNEYLQAGWDILKMKNQLSVELTGDIFPIEKHNVENGVRRALGRYIVQHFDESGWPDSIAKICGKKVVDYPFMVDDKKVKAVIEGVLGDLEQRTTEDFTKNLDGGENEKARSTGENG